MVDGLSVVVTVVVVALSIVGVAVSVVVELDVVDSSSLVSLQAVNAAIASTKKSFFMFSVF